MASFIARTLDHSNLRPEGLAIQRNSNRETMVSYRDADFAPIEDARIDVFSALYPDDAFDADDGECEGNFVKDETPSHSTCAIDIGDQLTDDEGNVMFTLVSDSDPITATCATDWATAALAGSTSAAGSEGRTFWAWTGDLGDEVSSETDLQELEDVARPVGKAGPDYARITGGLPTGDELAKMGETVTFTLQLYSQSRRCTQRRTRIVAVGPDRSSNPYHLRIQKYFVARYDGGRRPIPITAATEPETKAGDGLHRHGSVLEWLRDDWAYCGDRLNPTDIAGTTPSLLLSAVQHSG